MAEQLEFFRKLLLKRQQIERLTSLSRSHLYDLMAKDEFPKPVHLSDGRVAWIGGEVEDWIDARIAARDGGAAK